MRDFNEPIMNNIKPDQSVNTVNWRGRVEPRSYVKGKLFREGLRKPLPTVKQVPLRVVPAFSVQSLQKNTIVERPPKARPRKPRIQTRPTRFQVFYKRGDLPISIHFGNFGIKLLWKIELEKLDYHYYLPIFFDGLQDTKHPYRFFAFHGIQDLLKFGKERILPCIPQLIIPMKQALNTRNRKVIAATLEAVQLLVTSDESIGEALVPYYRQLLPVFNLFFNDDDNDGKDYDFGRLSKDYRIGKLIEETLNVLELHGGEDAFINIKYMVPNYESCTYN